MKKYSFKIPSIIGKITYMGTNLYETLRLVDHKNVSIYRDKKQY